MPCRSNQMTDDTTASGNDARRWVWEPFDANRTSLSGDIAKLFRNDAVKAPGIFAHDAPPPAAAVMAREVIQNSWDAANDAEFLKQISASHSAPPPPPPPPAIPDRF